MLEEVRIVMEASPSSPGVEGHGQGMKYNGKTYFYRAPLDVPRNRAVHLTWEGDYCGRVNGEKEYIIVCWNGHKFVLLEHLYCGVKDALKKYKGKNVSQAIGIIKKQQADDEAWREAQPKCSQCGKIVLRFYDGQPDDICAECFERPFDKLPKSERVFILFQMLFLAFNEGNIVTDSDEEIDLIKLACQYGKSQKLRPSDYQTIGRMTVEDVFVLFQGASKKVKPGVCLGCGHEFWPLDNGHCPNGCNTKKRS